MKSTKGKRGGCIGMKRRKIRSTPKDPLETCPSIKVKHEILDETSSSSSAKEIVYAEVIQGSESPPVVIVEQDSVTAPAHASKDCSNLDILSPESPKESTNSKLPSEDCTNSEVQSVDSSTKSRIDLSTSEDCKKFVKSELLSTNRPTSFKNEPKVEPNLSSDLFPYVDLAIENKIYEVQPQSVEANTRDETHDIIPNDFIRFSDEMKIRIMTRHPKAKSEDAEELLNLLKAEYHEIKFKDHSYLKMKPMPYRLKLMRNAKNCFVKLEILRNKKEFNFELNREFASEFSGFHEPESPFYPMTPMAPMASPQRSSRGGRVLKARSRTDDMLYYQTEYTSPSRSPLIKSVINTCRGRAGKKRIKTKNLIFNKLMSGRTDPFSPSPLPVPFAQIPPQKTKRVYNKKMKISSEKDFDDCSVINNLVAASQLPSLVSPLETPYANNYKETGVPSENPTLNNQSSNSTDKGCDSDVSSLDKFTPLISDGLPDKPNSSKECSQEKTKRTYKKRSKTADVIDLAYKALIKEEDECDVIGNLVTMKLRNILKMNPTMKILAEKLINETIFEAEMGTLTPYHSIVLDHSQSYSPGMDHSGVPYPCNFDQSVQTFPPFSVNHAPPPHPSTLPPPLPPHSLPLPPCTSTNQNPSGIVSTLSQNPPPGVSFNFNQNLSYFNPPPTSDHQPRHIARSTDRLNNSFLSL